MKTINDFIKYLKRKKYTFISVKEFEFYFEAEIKESGKNKHVVEKDFDEINADFSRVNPTKVIIYKRIR